MTLRLDVKDGKILALLGENARLSNTQIAKKVALSKPAVEYRIQRLEKNNVIFSYYTVIDFTRLGFMPYKLYLKFQGTSIEEEEKITNYWTQNQNTVWVAQTRGRWDVAVTIIADSNHAFGRILSDFMNKYAKYILEKDILLVEYSPIYVREYMRTNKGEFLYGLPVEKAIIDDIDKTILKNLSSNSRISIVELVKRTGLSRDIISYRMRKLEQQKIIAYYRCFLNYLALDLELSKIIIRTQNFDDKAEMKLKEYVQQHKHAGQLLKLIGSWDIEIELETKDDDELHDLLTDLRKEFSSIIRDFDILKITKTWKYDFYPF